MQQICGKFDLAGKRRKSPKNEELIEMTADPEINRSKVKLPEFNLMAFTPYRVAVAAQILSEQLARQYRDRFGISIPDWRVLVHLAHSGGVSVRDIEQRVAMEKSKVSRAATRLESRGLVAKKPSHGDKRLIELFLTEAGKELMSELLPLAADFQKKIEVHLGQSLKGFELGLDALLSEFGDP